MNFQTSKYNYSLLVKLHKKMKISKNNQKIKLLVSDLDGTLLNSKKEISPGNLQALKKCQSKNIIVTVATGRPSYKAKEFIKSLEFEKTNGYLISYNGALITECKTNKIIFSSFIPKEIVQQIIKKTTEMEIPIIFYKDETGELFTNKLKEKSDLVALIEKGEKKLTKIFEGEIPENLCTMELLFNNENKNKILKLKNEFTNLEIIESFYFGFTVTNKGIDKANAIDNLRKILKINVEEICAFGDNFNDESMLKYCGIGVAMGNANDDVKKIADFVSVDNENDGVAYAIKKLGIIDD